LEVEEMREQVKICAVVGIGLIGASLAAALKEANICQEVIGVDIDESSLVRAKEKELIDRILPLLDAVREADLIILATPVRQIINILKEIEPWVRPGTIIMDTGSTKASVVAAMNTLPEHIQAIGGHPMTGAATAGLDDASAKMFNGRVFVLTPTQRTNEATQIFAENLVQRIGARLIVVDADHHDRAAAIISHLPRLLSVALLNTAYVGKDELAWTLAAGGFCESTRKANENIPMWVDVLLTNQKGIIAAIHAFQDCLEEMAQHIEEGDEKISQAILEAAALEWNNHFNSSKYVR
jgi:prephenate dehydrogenase